MKNFIKVDEKVIVEFIKKCNPRYGIHTIYMDTYSFRLLQF